MKVSIRLWATCSIVLLLGIVLGACKSSGPSGDELIEKMEAAVKDVEQSHFTFEFQMATAAGGVGGTGEVWTKQPKMHRIEVTSDVADLKGVMAGNDGTRGWLLSPEQKRLYVGSGEIGSPNLRGQREVAAVLRYMDQIQEQGFKNAEATTLGSEEVNGRDTYKVQVEFEASDDPEKDMSSFDPIFWIDKETFLPQKVQVTLKRGALTAKGIVTLKGDVSQDDVDESLFAPPDLPEGYLQADFDAVIEMLPAEGDAPPGPPPENEGEIEIETE